MKSTIDYGRNYFKTANSDIFGIIDHAIMVVASDWPKEFGLHRDKIAERLFSCTLPKCSGCNEVEVAREGEKDDGECKRADEGTVADEAGGDKDVNKLETLIDEIEEESGVVGKVMRIKDILVNGRNDESDTEVFESLRRLQFMALSLDTLVATKIRKVVNVLRKHRSKRVCKLARTLMNGWKVLVDEWCRTAKPESLNLSVVNEDEGLPVPPLDEAYLFTTETAPIELLDEKFFDGMDDDGNPLMDHPKIEKKLKCPDEVGVRIRKRKVEELHDLPKHMKRRKPNRPLPQGRPHWKP
ncbi:probable mediator of RNA polymerase II transcription subunit 26a [Euphorbia lathyris]|uniref:probable mediator of RNA polymerase II transcription subunit 26a n=1 Tax=Euphorbia lathyris TaxID=212925 RepID=UPI0033131E37